MPIGEGPLADGSGSSGDEAKPVRDGGDPTSHAGSRAGPPPASREGMGYRLHGYCVDEAHPASDPMWFAQHGTPYPNPARGQMPPGPRIPMADPDPCPAQSIGVR